MKILINAINISGSGAIAILSSLLSPLTTKHQDWEFILYLPSNPEFQSLDLGKNVEIKFKKQNQGIKNNLFQLFALFIELPYITKNKKISLIVNFGDRAIFSTKIPQIVFFQQALLLYSDKELNGKRGWSSLKYRFFKGYLFLTSKFIKSIVVQTEIMKERLISQFSIEGNKIFVIGQPVPKKFYFSNDYVNPKILENKKPIKLLFLSNFYSHKNHEVLIPLANHITQLGLEYKIHFFITIDENFKSKEFLEDISKYSNIITNLGSIPNSQVKSALSISSALFLPTLAESYGLIYLEAMASGVPIITSDLDFSRSICGDLAIYFDVNNINSIINNILKLDNFDIKVYKERSISQLSNFPKDWNEVGDSFIAVIDQTMKNQ